MVTFAVETRGATAAAAGAENARRQTAIIASVREKGVQAAQISTGGYWVGPDERFDDGQRKVIGYIARNSIVVDVHQIERIGSLIDAALGAGANSVGGLQYYSTVAEQNRRTALERAVTKARSDAEVMARAAGGTLGLPIEIRTVDAGVPRQMGDVMLTARAMGAGPETPVSIGEQRVSVTVVTRWRFVPSR